MKYRYLALVALVSGALGVASFGLAQDKRPVDFEDILSMKSVGLPQISPDGASVLYTVTGWEEGDKEGAKTFVSHLWRVASEGGGAMQLTFGEKGESGPRWSPDSKWMSFLAARGSGKTKEDEDEPKRQIWLMRAAGGEAMPLTEAKEGVLDYVWSPDGGKIAFTSKEALSEDDEEKKERRDDPLVYEDDARFNRLWVIDVSSKDAVIQTEASAFTVKGRPSWSPDGTRIAFTGAPTLWLRDSRDDVYVLPVGGAARKITENPGADRSPVWSPDGKAIAFLSIPNDSEPLPDGTLIQPLTNAHLTIYDVQEGGLRDVSTGFDRIPSNSRWTPDSRRILFTAGDSVYREVFAYDVASRRYVKLTDERFVGLGSVSADGSWVAFTLESGEAPSDVYVSGLDFSTVEKLSDVHPDTRELALGETEVIRWKSTEGFEVEGVLVKPVGYLQGERYPLMTVAHGGPTGAHHDFYRVRYGDGGQHWAGQGWAVLYPNPRGSTNYGETFMKGNLADWGGGDYRDIMAGVDAVIEMGIADPDKLAFQGWSYGGYMTCWTVSQTTRFKAAMIGAGLTNLVSMYGTNDVPNYLGAFFNGTLSPETEQLYRDRSGLTFADQVTTPTLILHGGSDQRVPIGQPMEFYRALKDRGVSVELVFYPREGHGLREYYHRLDRLKRQFEWVTRHALGTAPATNE